MLTSVASADDRLDPKAWHDEAFGLSLHPTPEATLIDPPGEARVSFFDAAGSQITLYIRQTKTPVDTLTLMKKTVQQISYANPSSLMVDDPNPPDRLADRDATRIYFAIPDKERGDWVLGHIFILIDPYTIADLEFRGDATGFNEARQTFEAVAASVTLMDPAELNRIREQQLAAGQAWLQSIAPEHWRTNPTREQWLRILHEGKDIGYRRIRHKPDEQLGLPGLLIEVRSHVNAPNRQVDMIGEFFETDDASTEIWSNRVTYRTKQASPTLLNNTRTQTQHKPASFAETGLRTNGKMDVTLEATSRITPHQWQTPTAYLSQVKQRLIGPLLPRKTETLAFYTYTSAAESLTLMTLRTEPIQQGVWRGGYRVTLRPSPTMSPQTFVYNAQRQLVEWITAEGQLLKPTTPEEMRRIWNIPKNTSP